jgi:predicted NUDIX family NTP pyrophosphohydrolase
MQKVSAGILMYRYNPELEVFLVHPGGPYWKDRDEHAWDIPKGEIEEGEDFFDTAKREFLEETGINPPQNKEEYLYLNEIKRKDNKLIHIWAFEGDWSGLLMCSTYVKIEYPPKSNKFIKIPEVDKASFFNISKAKNKIYASLEPFLDKLIVNLESK